MVVSPAMSRPAFIKSGVLAELRRAGRFGALALVHLGRALVALLGHGLAAIVALIVVFEEWGWRPLANLLGQLARLKPIAWLEDRIRLLPPYGALVLFALPSASLFPLKLLALYLIAQGKTVLATALFVGAKVVGTALIARLYMLTEHSLMRIGWFKRAYDFLMPYKHALVDWVHESFAWRYGRVVKARMKAAVKPLFLAIRARVAGWFGAKPAEPKS